MNSPLKVLLVDDSPIFRSVLNKLISQDSRFQVVGLARHGREGLDMARDHHPDVVVLDVEMPVLGGIDTLKIMKRDFPDIQVIMFSAQTRQGAATTFKALDLGAFDYVAKPETGSIQDSLKAIETDLISKLIHLQGQLDRQPARAYPAARVISEAHPLVNHPLARPDGIMTKVVAVGISTGGPKALASMIPELSSNLKAGMLIVQHMPPVFTKSLAERLARETKLAVKEAEDGDVVEPGRILVAPGGRHMTVIRGANPLAPIKISLNDNPPENSCRPSADVLFRSVAQVYGAQAAGLIMTGMGSDGALGLRMMKEKGAFVIAQDEQTSTVFGMPKKPIEEGLVDVVLPLSQISTQINLIAAKH
jgi:two-component system chemotaxis response regulator CheB